MFPGVSVFNSLAKGDKAYCEGMLALADIHLGGPRNTDLQVHDERLFRRVLAEGSLGLGESYMDGWWDVESLDGFFDKLLRASLQESLSTTSLAAQVAKAKLLNMQSRQRSMRVIDCHYDLGNDLFEVMLDPHMQYTSGYWHRAEDLVQAQEHKLEQICQKLELRPGDRLLDLGCGFGGLARYAAEKHACQVTGYNISAEQLAWANKYCEGFSVTLIEADYREAKGSFDKISAIGLCEHVGYKNHRTLMEVAHRCLSDGGLFLLHCCAQNQTRVTTDPWLEKYIFPGSLLPSPSQLTSAFEGLFVLEDWHNFGVDYDRTLMAWWQNFEENWPKLEASERHGERFFRMWKYYLLMSAGSFRARKNQNWELVLSPRGVRRGYHSPR